MFEIGEGQHAVGLFPGCDHRSNRIIASYDEGVVIVIVVLLQPAYKLSSLRQCLLKAALQDLQHLGTVGLCQSELQGITIVYCCS